ncbi:MAG: serine hydroxymethyltransferase [Planctomycetes bacterium]|nr:serine hydroxymethyltransferase [Planctomycetota bacterium]MCW8136243.1 serine hydroxymethyltransferase [Planctomycetota bacterium]
MPTIEELILRERDRQTHSINLIASENFVSDYVLRCMGTVFTNKYAEGYPGKRWYGGCEFTDQVEQHAIDLAKQLFKAEHANVQPHSGTQSNLAAYMALIKPGDKVLAFKLEHGGHLSHGAAFNASGKFYKFVHYGVRREDGRIDEDEYTRLLKENPDIKLVVTGASSYPRAIDFKRLAGIAREHGALFMADVAHISGLVAAGVHQSPVDVADMVTMSTHKTIRGPRGGMVVCSAKWASKLDRAVFPGGQGGPLVHIVAAKAAMLEEALRPDFVQYQKQVIANAKAMAKAFTDIDSRKYRVLTGGTDNHMVMVDISGTGKSGIEVENLLGEQKIYVNKNFIPYDPLPVTQTSGIRVGSPLLTTLGAKEADFVQVVQLIDKAVNGENVAGEVQKFMADLSSRR